MITRRQFLIGSAAGLILPKWLVLAEEYLNDTGEPLLEPPSKTVDVITAIGEGKDYVLFLNYDPDPQVSYTWGELIGRYGLTHEELVDDWLEHFIFHGFKGDLTQKVDDTFAFDYWLEHESTDAKAFDLLKQLKIGTDRSDGKLAGSLIFTRGYHPGDGTPHVIAKDDITLSLLQKRLTDLGTGIEIVKGDY